MGVDQVCGSYTNDCEAMFARAGADFTRYGNAPCSEAAGPLSVAVQCMESDPDTFKALAPETHWGRDTEYEEALKFLRYLAVASARSPKATLRVRLVARR